MSHKAQKHEVCWQSDLSERIDLDAHLFQKTNKDKITTGLESLKAGATHTAGDSLHGQCCWRKNIPNLFQKT